MASLSRRLVLKRPWWLSLRSKAVRNSVMMILVAAVSAVDESHPSVTIRKIAFGSCHKRKYVQPHEGLIWDAIADTKPDAFLWTGDAVYSPKRGVASVDELQVEYNHMLTNDTLGYTGFQPPHGIYGTWDDHDYGGNDYGVEMSNKEERRDAFLDFLGKPHGSSENRKGVYNSVEWGQAPHKIKAILLDTRWHRQLHCIPSIATKVPLGSALTCITRWVTAGFNFPKYLPFCNNDASLLGQEQWQWLENELENSDSQVHVIVSSIQVLSSVPTFESWGFFQQERDRLLRLLNGVPGLILLSGDVHFAEVLDPTASASLEEETTSSSSLEERKKSFVEVTSSGLTHSCTTPFYGVLCQPLLEAFHAHRYTTRNNHDEVEPFYFIERNFGTLEIDWESKTLEARIHNREGTVVMSTGPRSLTRDIMTESELQNVVPCVDGHLIPVARKALILFVGFVLFVLWLLNFQRQLSTPKVSGSGSKAKSL